MQVLELFFQVLARTRCVEVESGARSVDHMLSNTVLPDISRKLLARMAEEQRAEKILLAANSEGEFVYEWNSPATSQQFVAA
jgi:type VI secretion system protein VasG